MASSPRSFCYEIKYIWNTKFFCVSYMLQDTSIGEFRANCFSFFPHETTPLGSSARLLRWKLLSVSILFLRTRKSVSPPLRLLLFCLLREKGRIAEEEPTTRVVRQKSANSWKRQLLIFLLFDISEISIIFLVSSRISSSMNYLIDQTMRVLITSWLRV